MYSVLVVAEALVVAASVRVPVDMVAATVAPAAWAATVAAPAAVALVHGGSQ